VFVIIRFNFELFVVWAVKQYNGCLVLQVEESLFFCVLYRASLAVSNRITLLYITISERERERERVLIHAHPIPMS
jgi:hypothetical protein